MSMDDLAGEKLSELQYIGKTIVPHECRGRIAGISAKHAPGPEVANPNDTILMNVLTSTLRRLVGEYECISVFYR